MPHQSAHTLVEAFGHNAAFSIEGGALHIGDTITVSTPMRKIHGVIEHFGLETLVLKFDDVTLHCRPWRAGDPSTPRLPGTSSRWITIKSAGASGSPTPVDHEHA